MHEECLTQKTGEVLKKLKGVSQKYKLILAGGTALALHIGHRISVDLDFFTNHPFSTDAIFQEMSKLKLSPKLGQEAENTLLVTCDDVKVSVFKYPYSFTKPLVQWKGVSVAGVLDIAAMKVIAISQRGTKRDFVDLYMVLQDIPFRKVAENMIQLFGKNRINSVHIGKSMVYCADADGDPDPKYRGRIHPEWTEIKEFFRKNVKQMTLDMT